MTNQALSMQQTCPVCGAVSHALDVVDFNKSCIESDNKFLPLSGIPIYYFLCEECAFCFAPEICQWPVSEFESKIYNEAYIEVDPDYVDARPRNNAANLIGMFGDMGKQFRHLDYGGGGGLLSAVLRDAGWNSHSYDPFANKDVRPEDLGRFDLISAFEVFEHVPDPVALMQGLGALLAPDGAVLFTTLLSDENIKHNQRLNWWYAAPRNGHISLFSTKSLSILVQRDGFSFDSLSAGVHILWKNSPPLWAQQFIEAE
ncbi:MAG: class I SAM-dependent methyltransferase [Burkholderiales bacterium]